MANENKKDFNAMLNNSKDMPKLVEMTDEKAIKQWGGRTLVIAPPVDYDKYMRLIPEGKLITSNEIRKQIANDYHADVTCPLTAGIFINMAAWASSQRKTDNTPYWRTLKSDGELNPKYPGGIEEQKTKLEAEGHSIIEKGRTNKRYFVEDYEQKLYKLGGK